MFKILKIFIISLLFTTLTVFAIEIPLTEEDISTQLIPSNPIPYKNTQIKISSYATNLNEAQIEWRSGSTVIQSGIGKTSYVFKALGPNKITIFDLTITPQGQTEAIEKRIAIKPTEIDMLVESVDGYVPPFYRGASFPTQESVIRITAVPNTSVIKQGRGSLTYKWKKSDFSQENVSGYNKNSYTFKNNNLDDSEEISVQASTVGGEFNGIGEVIVAIKKPIVLFYKKTAGQGVLYNQVLFNDVYINETETTIVAVPYFLPIVGEESSFNYKWKVNGDEIETPSEKTEITVRPASRGGYATIDVSFENLNSLFQRVAGRLKFNL